jgi:hypothetical protein
VNTTDKVDLYYTTNASSPSWTALATSLACSATGGTKVFTQTFTAGAAAGVHAVRAQLRFGGIAGTCTPGNYNERDDLAFSVADQVAQAK